MRPMGAFEPAHEREPARRVFASEFRETRYQFKDGEDEKSPNYVILPTGVRSNRVFIVGTLTVKERKGDQNVFYSGRVVDPTGTFFIRAGSYRPEAMQQFARIEPPAFVAVVGKPSLYTTPEGNCLTSINAESITVVDRETRDLWVLDTARETLDRLDAFGTTEDSKKAQEEYGTQPDLYRKIVYDALSQVQL